MDWQSYEFWIDLLDDIAYRRGDGNALAEGGIRAAEILGIGTDAVRRYYSGWGYSGHWDGHAAFVNHIVFPFWVAAAIHWAMDTRDPASSTHGYIQSVMRWSPLGFLGTQGDAPVTWEHMRGIGERVYGRADTCDGASGYEGKELPSHFHSLRSIMKDCLPSDDQVFPLIYSRTTDDRFCRILDIDGPDVDAALLSAGTGVDWDTASLTHAARRVLNLERAISIRHYARDRKMDERALPSFEYDENWVNPELGVRHALDRRRFDPVMDAYLRLHGWDVSTGWPTDETMNELGLAAESAKMKAGAARARERLPKLEPVAAVPDPHKNDPDRQDAKSVA